MTINMNKHITLGMKHSRREMASEVSSYIYITKLKKKKRNMKVGLEKKDWVKNM